MSVWIAVIAGWLVLAVLVTTAFAAVARGGQHEERRAHERIDERPLINSR